MTIDPTQDGVAISTAGDVPLSDGIQYDLPCRCGYNLRGLREAGRCPECGYGIARLQEELEQASLDGAARRRFGAALLIGNHLAWLSMMAGWLVHIGPDLRPALVLLATAGPRSVTAIEVFKPNTLRTFATTVYMLMALHLLGVWLLTTVKPDEHLNNLRRFGRIFFFAQLLAAAAAVALFLAITPTNLRLIIWLNLIELPIGILFGEHFARLGAVEQSQVIRIGGRVVSALLAFSSLVIAATVFFTVPPNSPTGAWFYVALFAAAVAGLLLLSLMFRVRKVLQSDD